MPGHTLVLFERNNMPTFNDFNLPEKLLACLTQMGFTEPTPIQEQAIPLAMDGKDILGSAQTGTGKTGAFGIPVVAKLMADRTATALIMTPTRELATQVCEAIKQMCNPRDLRTALLIGGESMPKQFRQLDQGARIIVGTPGRINDHLNRGSLSLENAFFLVLDETDRMLDMGFGIQIEESIHQMPRERQTMMFSATLPANIVKLSSKYLNDPVRIAAGSTNTPIAKIDQAQMHISDGEKFGALMDELETREGSVIIFVKTKHGTERLADKLNNKGHAADAIHGDLQQRRRDRVIQDFRHKEYRILVATDVAARGLDIPHIEHVINYDMPQNPEDYIHRIGRTGRAGATGAALNFITPADGSKWRAITQLISGKPVTGDNGERNGGGRKRSFSGPKRGGFGNGNSRSSEGRGGEGRDFKAGEGRGEGRSEGRSFGGENRGGRTEGRGAPRAEGARSEGGARKEGGAKPGAWKDRNAVKRAQKKADGPRYPRAA